MTGGRLMLAEDVGVERLLEQAGDKDDAVRSAAFTRLLQIGEATPRELSARFERLVAMLDSPNGFHRSIGACLIARAAAGDPEPFDAAFDRYFGLLDDPSIMVARYAVQNAGRIARARPDLRARVSERLLRVDETHHPAARRDLLKADAVASLAEVVDEIPGADEIERGRIAAFVRAQLSSSSPKTRAAAKAFLADHPG